MRFATSALLTAAAATSAAAQSVVGTAYGFATGVTGGGSATAVTPSSASELASLLSDDTARTIIIDKEYDFTGETATDSGCDRKSCSADNGGQLYLGTLSCGGSDNVAVSSITYDVAGTEPLSVGSNKSILGVNGKGVLKGKGLSLKSGASNVIIQGIEITDLNPGIVWGGDALEFKGKNDGVWVDHNKFSLVGRMFIVTHYDATRLTVSNNEFDGTTTTSASCNSMHYWTAMFYGDGDQVTLDKNYFHNVSGRAPKLGEPSVKGTFQAVNNYFSNMQGHAFDAYDGATALIEGNVFDNVKTPFTDQAATVSTLFSADSSSASSCSSALGRACVANSASNGSGDLPSLSSTSSLSSFKSTYLVDPIAVDQVASHVQSNAGPSNLGSSSGGSDSGDDSTPVSSSVAVSSSVPTATTLSSVAVSSSVPTATTVSSVPSATSAPTATASPAQTSAPVSGGDSDDNCSDDGSSGSEDDTSGSDDTTEIAPYGQCGGQGFTGTGKCASGTSCVSHNEWYSQCLSSSARRRKRALVMKPIF
ncbi:unnamed protein product [Clonostachys solani]|uniref:pectin lyase n=1 Tax=Clonostachys solani TaxID=160281 RepID=A0A9P0ER18_9HYPO|nr:unnamed protein product [Clonostachys solani]